GVFAGGEGTHRNGRAAAQVAACAAALNAEVAGHRRQNRQSTDRLLAVSTALPAQILRQVARLGLRDLVRQIDDAARGNTGNFSGPFRRLLHALLDEYKVRHPLDESGRAYEKRVLADSNRVLCLESVVVHGYL